MEFLDSKQVAELLGVTPAYVRELINRGELQAKKVGNSFRIPKDEVNRMLGISEKVEYSKDLRIKELENEVNNLKLKLSLVRNLINNANAII